MFKVQLLINLFGPQDSLEKIVMHRLSGDNALVSFQVQRSSLRVQSGLPKSLNQPFGLPARPAALEQFLANPYCREYRNTGKSYSWP